MSSVDDRIVNMKFNNQQFTQGVAQSQKSLQNLEGSLSKTAQSKGLSSLASNVESVKGKFGALQIAGVSAIATIASKATSAGIGLVKALTLDPILDGWNEYNLNLTSTQTVMANTGKGIKTVGKYLDQLNTYSDLTIYNFAQMAHNVGTFSAAGVGLKESVAAIQGISNIAALSGSSAEQAAGAMYQLSQAIAAGRVNLQDWNSVVNAGMGGKNFQRMLIQTAEGMGKLSENSVDLGKNIKVMGKSFRESIGSKSGGAAPWLTSDILVKTLGLMDGRLSKTAITAKIMSKGQHTLAEATAIADDRLKKQQATLAKQGFNKEQIKNLTAMANRAYESATVVKTLPQLFGVVKESIGSIWSTAFRGLIGNFGQSKKMWTAASNAISKLTQGLNNNITSTIVLFNRAHGRVAFIDAVQTGFHAILNVLGAVKTAFRDVFPASQTSGLAKFATMLQTLAHALSPSAKTLSDLTDIFGGVFAVLHIGVTVVKALAAGFSAMFGGIFKGSGHARGGILDFLAKIGLMLQSVDTFLTSGGKMVDLFRNIGTAAGNSAGKAISIVTGIIQGLISGISGSAGGLKAAVEGLGTKIIDWIKGVLGIHSPSTAMKEIGQNAVLGLVQGLIMGVGLVLKGVGALGKAILSGISSMLDGIDPIQIAQVLNAIFTGALIVGVVKFANALSSIASGAGNALNGLGNALQSLQTKAKAELIRSIAISVGTLAASLLVLSMIPKAKLMSGIGAIGALMGMMTLMMTVMSKIGDEVKISKKGVEGGALQLIAIGKAIQSVATAMLILSAAVTLLGQQDPKKVARGIGEVSAMMAIMVGAIFAISKIGKVGLGAATSIVIIATAMDVLIAAVTALGLLPFDVVKQGLGAIGAAMGIMVTSLLILSDATVGVAKSAAAILIVASAMTVMAAAVAAFGMMDMKTLEKGFASVALSLGLFVATLMVLSSNALAVSLSANAILMMSGAMLAMAIAMKLLGGLSWESLAKGIVGVAAGFAIILAAAAVAEVVAPGLIILGVALEALGGALALAGLGMLAFGAGFALLAATGTAGVAVLLAAFHAFLAILPELGIQLAAAFVTFIQTIAAASPKLRAAFDTIFKNMIGTVRDSIPEIKGLVQDLISAAISVIKRSVSQWIEAGFYIMDHFIASVAKHVPKMADNALKAVTAFMNAISNNLGPLADSAAKMIISFINAISNAIDNNSKAMGEAGGRLGVSLVKGMISGMAGMAGQVIGAAEDLAKKALGGIHKIFHNPPSPSREGMKLGESLALGVADGISNATQAAVAAAVAMANAIIAAGDAAVARAQGNASNQQRAADAAQARADIADAAAKKVNAKKNPKLAKKLKKQADRADAAAQAAQDRADAAAQQVQDAKDFASADSVGKGDILSSKAVDLANQSARLLAKANAEAAEAKRLQKTNKKASKQMMAQARADAAAAQSLADQARAADASANQYYNDEVQKRLAAIAAEDQAAKEQAAFDAADNQGKIDILTKRAEAMQAKADAANQTAAGLIDQAKALAGTDAAQSLKLLDQADALRQDAKDAADAAQQARDQISQLVGQVAVNNNTSAASGVQPSRSVLEDAASIVDRYTASLAAATEAAASQQQVLQFVQNNNSPVALTASEIYRQTNNLLSAASIKMGAN